MKNIPLRDIMLRASIYIIMLLFAARVLGYLFHMVFAKYFTQQVYGEFIYLWSAALFIAGLMPNIAAAVERYVAYHRGSEDKEKVKKVVGSGMVLSITISFAMALLVASLYSFGILPKINDTLSILFIILVAFFVLTSNLLSAVITGHRRPEVSSAFNLLHTLLRLFAIVVASYAWVSLSGVIWLVLAAFLIFVISILIYVAKNYGVGSGYDRQVGGELLKFGAFTVFHETANNILSWGNIFLINIFLGAAVVAVYNVAWLASTASLVLFLSVLQIFSPVVTELFGAGKKKQAEYLSSYLLESFFLLFLPVFVLIVLFSEELLVLFISTTYSSGAAPLRILALGAFFFGVSRLFMVLIASSGKPQVNAKNIGFVAILSILLNLILIPIYGMVGAAIATLASSLCLYILSHGYVHKNIMQLKFISKRSAKLIIASAAAFALTYSLGLYFEVPMTLRISSLAIFFLAVYSLVVLFSKSLRREDVEMFCTILEKTGAPKKLTDSISRFLGFAVGY